MSGLEFYLLGHPQLSFAGETLEFSLKKALALLSYLAVEGLGQKETG
jgi:hypothetical protein